VSAADIAEPPRVTWQQWLDLEDVSEERHELFAGRLVLDQGGTDRHDTVVTSLYDRLAAPFQEQRSRVYPHNRKVVTPSGDGYYPDLLIRCGPRTDERYESAPTWIVEVVSPSNSLPEMQAKLRAYLATPSLAGYVVVEPTTRIVQAYVRHEGEWRVLDVTDRTLPIGPVLVDFAEVFAEVAELEAFGG
jgi:Uma2 family endonuclease